MLKYKVQQNEYRIRREWIGHLLPIIINSINTWSTFFHQSFFIHFSYSRISWCVCCVVLLISGCWHHHHASSIHPSVMNLMRSFCSVSFFSVAKQSNICMLGVNHRDDDDDDDNSSCWQCCWKKNSFKQIRILVRILLCSSE